MNLLDLQFLESIPCRVLLIPPKVVMKAENPQESFQHLLIELMYAWLALECQFHWQTKM